MARAPARYIGLLKVECRLEALDETARRPPILRRSMMLLLRLPRAATLADASATPGKRRAGLARREKFGNGARAARMVNLYLFCEGIQERTEIATTTVQWSSANATVTAHALEIKARACFRNSANGHSAGFNVCRALFILLRLCKFFCTSLVHSKKVENESGGPRSLTLVFHRNGFYGRRRNCLRIF